MATTYTGHAFGLNLYNGSTTISDGTCSGYVKSIEAIITARKDSAQVQATVRIDLTSPADAKIADLISYSELDEEWANDKIENYLTNNHGEIKTYLDNKILNSKKPAIVEVLQNDLPWG